LKGKTLFFNDGSNTLNVTFASAPANLSAVVTAIQGATGYSDMDFTVSAGTNALTLTYANALGDVQLAEVTSSVVGDYTVNELGRITDGLEEDVVLIEGARDLGDLTFSRTEVASEDTDATLKIDYNQYRGVENADEGISVDDIHGSGSITLFNQFSTTQSSIYQVEKIQIGEEQDAENASDPFAMAVKTYYIAESSDDTSVTGITKGDGDVLSAASDVDSVMIGEAGLGDVFEISGPTSASASINPGTIAADHQEVFIYGMVNSGGTVLDTTDQIIIKSNYLSSSTALSDPIGIGTSGTLFSGTVGYGITSGSFEDTNANDYAKISFEFGGDDADLSSSADNYFLDLYLADAGNIDSQSLLDRIKWEI